MSIPDRLHGTTQFGTGMTEWQTRRFSHGNVCPLCALVGDHTMIGNDSRWCHKHKMHMQYKLKRFRHYMVRWFQEKGIQVQDEYLYTRRLRPSQRGKI